MSSFLAVITVLGGEPGYPAHPIAPGGPPPGIWPSPGYPAHPIVIPPPPQGPEPPTEGVKPPPPEGGWGYSPEYGWGYFPAGDKPNPAPERPQVNPLGKK